eukprot:19817_1
MHFCRLRLVCHRIFHALIPLTHQPNHFVCNSFHACRQSFQDAKDPLTKTSPWNQTFDKDYEGMMNGFFLFSYALSMLLIGSQLGDKFSASTVHSLGLLGVSTIYFILGASIPLFNLNSRIFFCILWVINGIVQSVGWPTGVKLMANWFDGAHDGMIFGVWTACQCTGNIIGSAYDDYVDAHNLPMQWNFWLPAIQAAVIGIVVFICVPTYPKGMIPIRSHSRVSSLARSDVIQNAPSISDHEGDEGVGLREALKLPNIMMYGLIFACLKGVNYTLFFWLPDFLETGSNFTDDEADKLSIYYNVGQIIGSWFCGLISDRFVKRTPVIFVFLLLSVTPIFMFRIPDPSYDFVAILSSVAGFFMGGPSNLISSVMAAEVGKQQTKEGKPASLSTLSGIVDGMGGFGAAICVFVSTYLPVSVVFIILSALVVMAGLLLLPLTIEDVKYIIATKNGRELQQPLVSQEGAAAMLANDQIRRDN